MRTLGAGAKSLLRSALLGSVSGAVAMLGPLVRRFGPNPPAYVDAPEILLIRIDLLGDVVFSLAGARAVKESFPGSRVTMLTLPQTADVARACVDVDDVISLDTNLIRSPRTLCRPATLSHLMSGLVRLRGQRFDACVSLSGRTASLLALLTRSSVRIGFGDEAYPGSLDIRVPGGRQLRSRRVHDVKRVLRLVEEVPRGLGRTPDPAARPTPPRLLVGPGAHDAVRATLDRAGILGGEQYIALHLGSGYGDFKRWPAAYFSSLAGSLAERGLRTVVIGAAAEATLAGLVAGSSPAISLAGQTSLVELMALLQGASAVVGGDSGPLHLAIALGTPAVALFGPTDPLVNGPVGWRGQSIKTLRAGIVCSPCYSVATRAECPLGHPICMDLISPQRVLAALEDALTSVKDEFLMPEQHALQNAQ